MSISKELLLAIVSMASNNSGHNSGLSDGDTVISFRGTDNLNPFDGANDIFNGWVSGAGFTTGQVPLAFDFYQAVTGNEHYQKTDNAVLTGHSLGGGLAGITAALMRLVTLIRKSINCGI